MPYVKPNGISHRDWFIAAVPVHNQFGFQGYHQTLGSHSDGHIYPTAAAAILAGCRFIDRELAIAALAPILIEWLRQDKITMDEYWNLSCFKETEV